MKHIYFTNIVDCLIFEFSFSLFFELGDLDVIGWCEESRGRGLFGRFECVGWMNAKTPDEEFSVLTFACVVCEEFQRNICYFIVTRSWMVH